MTWIIEGHRNKPATIKQYIRQCPYRNNLRCEMWDCGGCREKENYKLHEQMRLGYVEMYKR